MSEVSPTVAFLYEEITHQRAENERLTKGREGEDMMLARAAYNAGREAEQGGRIARDPRVILSIARAALGDDRGKGDD